MHKLWDSIKSGYLRLIEPVADFLVRRNVNPNVITTIGTICTLAAAAIFASGHISIGGWVLGITAVFDVLDGIVARRTGRQTAFGAFYDSSLDRISDGALLGGLLVFYSVASPHHSVPMVVISLLAILGTFLTSYTRARAESLGIDAKVGLMQRPERVVLLSAPQAFFGCIRWLGAGRNHYTTVCDIVDHGRAAHAVRISPDLACSAHVSAPSQRRGQPAERQIRAGRLSSYGARSVAAIRPFTRILCPFRQPLRAPRP